MHVHLGFMANAKEVAAEARAAGTLMFANTVTPEEWNVARAEFADFENVAVGFGMHPWWVGRRRDELAAIGRALESLEAHDPRKAHGSLDSHGPLEVLDSLEAHDPRFIGEVGLDFGKRHGQTRDEQMAVFKAIIDWAAGRGGKLLSVHSVHASADVLDALAASGILESCQVIFHWFTGPSDQLKRAIDAGCFFSVGPRMLATGKGREYVKAIPERRLLLETDAPPAQGQAYSFGELRAELLAAAAGVESIKGDGVLDVIAQTSAELLGKTG